MTELTFDITANGNDDTAYYQDSVWPPNGGTFTVEASTPGLGYVSKTFNGGTYSMDFVCMRFDTSTIPDDATIDTAVLRLYMDDIADAQPFSLLADAYDFGGAPLVAGDWIEVASPAIFTLALGDITYPGLTDISISSSAINAAGFTGIRFTLNAFATPNADNWARIILREHATLAAPQLIVNYTEAAAGQTLRPDADTTTTGWTTTPLWSKLDDDPAGGDVVTATAA